MSQIQKHLSRLAMPKTWKIKRKGIKWVSRPSPGAHKIKEGMPLNVLLRDVIGCARTTKEVKKIIHNKDVLVDGKERRDHRFIVGIMDVVSIPKTKEYFRILYNEKGHIMALPIKEAESKIKPCKVTGKTVMKKGKLQLNLFDGKNIPLDKTDANVGDVVFIELPSQKIKETVKLEKGAYIFLTGGKHMATSGIVEEIKGHRIIYKKGNETLETLKDYAFAIGKAKPNITLIK